jgi:hypothetical protein
MLFQPSEGEFHGWAIALRAGPSPRCEAVRSPRAPTDPPPPCGEGLGVGGRFNTIAFDLSGTIAAMCSPRQCPRRSFLSDIHPTPSPSPSRGGEIPAALFAFTRVPRRLQGRRIALARVGVTAKVRRPKWAHRGR